MKEHVVFTDWDVFQDLGKVNPEATSQWPQTSLSGLSRMEPSLDNQSGEKNTHFMEAATQTASPPMSDVALTR